MDMVLVATVFAILLFHSCSFPVASVYIDGILGFLVCMTVFIEQNTADPLQYKSSAFSEVQFAEVMVFLSFIGMHSSVVIFTLILAVVNACTVEAEVISIGDILQTMMVTAFTAFGCVCLEFFVASLYHELQTQLDGNKRLLDTATDGFGTVDSTTGCLTQVSPKMAQTLNRMDLLGESLCAFVDGRDHNLLHQFYGDAEQGVQPCAILVTCNAGTMEFEVRLIPYRACGTDIGFCVQMVGEPRSTLPASQTGQQFPSEEDAKRTSSSNDEVVQANLPRSGDQTETEGEGPTPLREFPRYFRDDASHTSNTLTLSSWTASLQSVPPRRQVMDIGVQTGQDPKRRRPPAPLSASTLFSGGTVARRRRKTAEVTLAQIEEGKPAVAGFAATPTSTRGNSVENLLKSFNITGRGCCSKHIAYTDVQRIVGEELSRKCGTLTHHSDWQCSSCLSLNPWDDEEEFDEEDEDVAEQVCVVCQAVVQPLVRNDTNGASQDPDCIFASSSGGDGSASSVDSVHPTRDSSDTAVHE